MCNRVLLVNEVDTFFSRDFYGNTYNPCTLLTDDDVIEAIKFIWNNRNDNSSQIEHKLKSTLSYTKVCATYNDCRDKIDTQFKMMIEDVKTCKSREYIVRDNKIGYK